MSVGTWVNIGVLVLVIVFSVAAIRASGRAARATRQATAEKERSLEVLAEAQKLARPGPRLLPWPADDEPQRPPSPLVVDLRESPDGQPVTVVFDRRPIGSRDDADWELWAGPYPVGPTTLEIRSPDVLPASAGPLCKVRARVMWGDVMAAEFFSVTPVYPGDHYAVTLLPNLHRT